MKVILFILALTTLFSCSQENESIMNNEFITYVESFKIEATQRNINIDKELSVLSVVFSELEDDIVGQCVSYSDGSKKILISPTKWNNEDSMGKELLLFHELGHCVLHRDHLNTTNRKSCISIMRESNSICELNYNYENRETYLDELFK